MMKPSASSRNFACSRLPSGRCASAVGRIGSVLIRQCWAALFLDESVGRRIGGRRIVRETTLAEKRTAGCRAGWGKRLRHAYTASTPCARIWIFCRRATWDVPPAQTTIERVVASSSAQAALELAIRWLQANAPTCASPVVVHGDFRIGNLMVGPEVLRGVFDWEFAHLGDPAEDLTWPCVRSWRFGQDRLAGFRLGGIASGRVFSGLRAGRRIGCRSSGRTLVEILGNLRWAVGCMLRANRHLSQQRAEHRASQLGGGEASAEMELELLELIERVFSP